MVSLLSIKNSESGSGVSTTGFPSGREAMLRDVGAAFSAAGENIYLVGGAVRDVLLGAEPDDFDFVTSASPQSIRRIMGKTARTIYDISRAKGYGTQGVILRDGTEIEITPYRSVAACCDESTSAGEDFLSDDLAARDFTINSIAADIAPGAFGALSDPCGGVADLERRILRTPRAPLETLKDDPVRTLRAARFSTAFGLTHDDMLADAVKYVVRQTDWLGRVAAERVRVELEKMLMLPQPSRGVRLMREWGLVDYWIPELANLMELEPEPDTSHKNMLEHTLAVLDRAAEAGPATARFRMAALLHDIGKPAARCLSEGGYTFRDHDKIGAELAAEICRRLRFSNEDVEYITTLVARHHRLSAYDDDWTDSAVRRAVNELGEKFDDIAALTTADITTSFEDVRAEREARIGRFRRRVEELDATQALNPKPPIDGNEIMKLLGAGPGKRVGVAMNMLKQKIIDGELSPDDAEGARALVRESAGGKTFA